MVMGLSMGRVLGAGGGGRETIPAGRWTSIRDRAGARCRSVVSYPSEPEPLPMRVLFAIDEFSLERGCRYAGVAGRAPCGAGCTIFAVDALARRAGRLPQV